MNNRFRIHGTFSRRLNPSALRHSLAIRTGAGALHVMAKPVAPENVATSDGPTIPAILQSDDLAA